MAYKQKSPIILAEGGTNATSMATTDGVVYYDGTRLVTTAVGTATQVLTSNGAGVAPTFQDAGGGGGGITTIAGDSGSATGATVTFDAATNAGPTISFLASGSTVSLKVTEISFGTGNTVIGASSHKGTGTNVTGFGYNNFHSTGNYSNCVAIGSNNLISMTTGGGSVAIGTFCLQSASAPGGCIAIGGGAMSLGDTTGEGNIGLGGQSANSLSSGANNCLISTLSGAYIDTGSNNIGIGYSTFGTQLGLSGGLTSGSNNVGIGFQVGSNYASNESFNILVGQTYGVTGESRVTRIGNGDSGTPQSACYIEGINGVTVTGTAVLCATDGKLGTVSSSIRYKDNVVDMADNNVMKLRPVNFTYKKSDVLQYGLIAEEVEEVFKDLVFYNAEGKPESVHYEKLPAILLHELQKQNKRIEALEALLANK